MELLVELRLRRSKDLAYVYSQRTYPDLVTRPLFDDPMVVLSHRDSGYPDVLSPSDLNAEEEVFLSWNNAYQRWHGLHWPQGRQLITVGVSNQVSRFLDGTGRWAIVPLSAHLALGDSSPFRASKLDTPPQPLRCLEVIHRHPKEGSLEALGIFRERMEGYLQSLGLSAG